MEKDEKKTIETELKDARERLHYLLGVSPAIIYTTQVSGDPVCTFVSENIHAILGHTPQEMTADPKFWPSRLHPEDAPRVFDEVFPLIDRGGGTLEYRFQHRQGHYLWFQDTFKVIHDEAGHPLEIVGSWADINERKQAEMAPVAPLSNLKMHLIDSDGKEIPGVLYAKVVETPRESHTAFSVRFTSMSPEIETFLRGLLT